MSIVANEDWIATTDTIPIGDLNITASEPCLVQISRTPTGDTVTGVASLQGVLFEWS